MDPVYVSGKVSESGKPKFLRVAIVIIRHLRPNSWKKSRQKS
jgi:hypothetical protein